MTQPKGVDSRSLHAMSVQDILSRSRSACLGHFVGLGAFLIFTGTHQAFFWPTFWMAALLSLTSLVRWSIAGTPLYLILKFYKAYQSLIYISAVSWAVLTLLCVRATGDFDREWIFASFIVAGVSAASVASLCSDFKMGRNYLAIILVPPSIDFLFFHDKMVPLGLMLLAYLLILIRQLRVHSLSAWDHYRALLEIERQQKEIEEHRAQSIQSAKMSSLGEMSGAIAHEINNPLTIISGLSTQLIRQVESPQKYGEKIKKSAHTINRTVDRISRIIKGLRSFARDGSGDPMERVAVQKLIEEALELSQERLKNSGIDLTIDTPDAEVPIWARNTEIVQVLLNLLNNAFHAVQNSDPKWIRVELKALSDHAEIRMLDSGPGVSPAIADRIMEPFFTTKSLGEGTGLGLSISSGIISSHHGDLRYDSHASHSCFVIQLPLAEKAPKDLEEPQERAQASKS